MGYWEGETERAKRHLVVRIYHSKVGRTVYHIESMSVAHSTHPHLGLDFRGSFPLVPWAQEQWIASKHVCGITEL